MLLATEIGALSCAILLLFSQIKDLEIPSILVVNMADQLKSKGIEIDVK
mgnify:CR=1 FL=1